MKSQSIRDTVFSLRRNGYSYSYISNKVNISKSTLSDWLKNIKYVPNQETIKTIGKARSASIKARQDIRLKSLKEANQLAKEDIGIISKRDRFMIGVGLYLGEGTKTHNIIRLINANPEIIRFAINWFKEVVGLTEKNFKIRLHLYPDNDQEESINFWSKAVSLPRSQFQKISIDFRKDKKMSKRGKLPYGTAHLSVKSCGEKRFGVFLARRINGWISAVLKK